MKEWSIKLKKGTLRLTVLEDGTLLIASYEGQRIYKYELLKELKKNGIIGGYIDPCLELIVAGHKGEIPIARAFLEDEPPIFEYHFEKKYSRQELIHLLTHQKVPDVNFFPEVEAKMNLLSVKSPPHLIRIYPEGRRETVHEIDGYGLQYFKGNHVACNHESNSIYSEIEGTAHYSPFGRVHVFPPEKIKSVGKIHGEQNFKSAIWIEDDIRTGSTLNTVSNLYVGGLIRSSRVSAEGNITAAFSFENPRRNENSIASAGNSVFASAIRNYIVRSYRDIIVRNSIENSIIRNYHIIYAPIIRASEVRVGGKLFAHEIIDGCKLYLGLKFLKNSLATEVRKTHKEHEQGLSRLKGELIYLRKRLITLQENTAKHFAKIKGSQPAAIHGDVFLKKYYSSQVNGFKEFARKLADFEQLYKEYKREHYTLSYYKQQYEQNRPTEIIVTGKIEAGTTLHAPEQTIQFKADQSHVAIILDDITGKIKIEPLQH